MDYRRTVKEFFLVGIRNDLPNDFNFPKTIPLKLRLKDILEDIVDEKYYLSEKLIKGFMSKPSIESFPFTPMDINTDKVCPTITARIHKCSSSDPYLKVSNIGNVNPSGNGMNGNLFSDEGLCPTLTTNKGEGIKVQVKSERIAGWFENENVIGAYRDDAKRSSVSEHIYQKENSVCNTIQTAHVPKLIQEVKIGAMRGRNPENPSDRTPGAPTQQMLEINENGTSNCLTSVQKDNLVIEKPYLEFQIADYRADEGLRIRKDSISPCMTSSMRDSPEWNPKAGTRNPPITSNGFRIRKLTPREVFRLQGFLDEFLQNAIDAGVSNSQLYRQAGNSISVTVIQAILKNLLK